MRSNAHISITAAVLAACGGGATEPARCAPGELECYAAALRVSEETGERIELVSVATAQLEAVPEPPPPEPGSPHVWAVGPSIYGYDGQAWFEEVDDVTVGDLRAVWGSGVDDVWAVGFNGETWHRDANGWSLVTAGTVTLNDLWGDGPGDVWAVGSGGTILHWDGTAWMPSASGTAEDLLSVSGHGPIKASIPGEVWAVGAGGTILRRNGTAAWAPMLSPTSQRLNAVVAQSVDAWAGGEGAAVFRWCNGQWIDYTDSTMPCAHVRSGSPPGPVFALPTSILDLWADAGGIWLAGHSITGFEIHRYNGSKWTATPGIGGYALHGVNADDVWVAGDTIYHWNGTTWIETPAPDAGTFAGIWAGAPTEPGQDVRQPTITNQPAPLVHMSGAGVPLDVDWADPNPCRPGFCMTVCNSAKVRCVTSTLCIPPRLDGLSSGRTRFLVSVAAVPESVPEDLTLAVTPVSSADCEPFDELGASGTADVGATVDVEQTVHPPPTGGGTVDAWNGGYTCAVHTVTPAGTTDLTGTFSCTAGACSDPAGTFTGTVQANGSFAGSSTVCGGCTPLAIAGVFDAGAPFMLSGSSGSVSQTMTCSKN